MERSVYTLNTTEKMSWIDAFWEGLCGVVDISFHNSHRVYNQKRLDEIKAMIEVNGFETDVEKLKGDLFKLRADFEKSYNRIKHELEEGSTYK